MKLSWQQTLRQNIGITISFVGLVIFSVALFPSLTRAIQTPTTGQNVPQGNDNNSLLIVGLVFMVSGLLIRVWQTVLPLVRSTTRPTRPDRKSGL